MQTEIRLLLDANGKYSGGLLSGNRFWLGAVSQCRELDNEFIQYRLFNASNRGKVDLDGIPPFPVAVNSVNVQFRSPEIRLNTIHITIGLCLPSSCQSIDVKKLLNFGIDESLKATSTEKEIRINYVRNLSEGYSLWHDSTFQIILTTSIFVIFMVIMGTSYDIALRYKVLSSLKSENSNNVSIVRQHKTLKYEESFIKKDNNVFTFSKLWSIKEHNATLDLWNTKSVPKPMSEALLSFSLLLNISKLASLDVGHDTLAPIHGIRLISMLWIIMVHMCLIANEVSDTHLFRKVAERDFFYQTISNGTYAVDSFFFVSGCLVTFLYFRTMSKRRLNEKKITQGAIGKILQFIGLVFYRYFRLTPPYLLAIGIVQTLMKWYHDHSAIELPTLDHETCKKFWWRNAIYLNTYFAMEERCMVWSWYLANDTQFYIFGIIILIIGSSYLTAAAIIGVFVLITSWIVTTVIAFNTNHIPTIQDPFAHYESLYDKPWTRIGPYLIGMAVGWFLYRIDCKLKINKPIKIAGWTASIVTLLSIVYGLYGNTLGPVSSTMYTVFSHSGWAVSVAWVLIVCVTQNGGFVNTFLSWKYLYPLSRLTYCVYLIHPTLMRAMILHSESSLHLSRVFIAILFFGATIASYTAALILSLLFEAPMVSFLRIFHPLRHWKNYIKKSSDSSRNQSKIEGQIVLN
ncbi:nose resistant to fluoxetine protein 6-like isoform X2 [Chelonus insularis]|uniref:nose resistant to fluoxetine protein 6-like isoform X2 n=1 Tax=Chelonus insularis TaxID=460826 RepID=UPI0015895A94|nr:nose resistant to fluoxetine protein 6-like isoform X2 [Chelonus insularis]